MPIYEYGCRSCGHTLEALQKLADKPLRKCPECDKPGLKRLMSAPAFRLKGGGWYETDFKSGDEKKRNLADGGDKPKEEVARKDEEKPKSKDGEKAGTPDKSPSKSKKHEAKETKTTAKSARKSAGSEAA
jgi:putative FmdB family regulatory protein